MTTIQSEYRLGALDVLKEQGRIILALMLYDIRSRFGGNALGFVTMGVVWPLSHILILLLINTLLGRAPPYGDSAALWFATGTVPFLSFQYMSRFMSLGLIVSCSLLQYPVVKTTDILFARALIEILNTVFVVLILFAIFWMLGIDFMPRNVAQAAFAMLAMMLLGLGFGVISAVIAGAFPLWATAYAVSMMLFWVSSGVIFVPDAMPEVVRIPLSYLPWLQGVEWMRSAYYEGLGVNILDKPYLITFGFVTLALGLGLERLLRGKLV